MKLDTQIPVRFLETAFHDDDLLAIAYRCLPSKAWNHRFVTARAARTTKFLAWLRFLNAKRHDIFVGMNVFAGRANGRTEQNVSVVRHIYADFDSGGAAALAGLRARADLPPASYVVHSSAGKFQVVWNVRDFEPAHAKRLLHYLAYSLGADTAVHDLNRVLRLPGFYNYKYDPPQFIRMETGDLTARGPDAFPVPADDVRTLLNCPRTRTRSAPLPGTTKAISPSERDWATVRSALAQGRPWQMVKAELFAARQDKVNPRFYACLTVLKALNSLDQPDPPELVAEMLDSKSRPSERINERRPS